MTEKRVRTYVKIGVAGPVGSGKTALIERLAEKGCEYGWKPTKQMIKTAMQPKPAEA